MRPDRQKQMLAYLTRPAMAQGGRIPFDNGGDTSPVKTEEYKYPRSNRFGTVYSKTPGTNQYGALTRSLEEVQAIIDNADPIPKKNKLVEMNPKDLEGRSEYNNVKENKGPAKVFVSRKELKKYEGKLKFKKTGKAVLEERSKYSEARKARDLARSNPSILNKLAGKNGFQLSHLSLGELDTLKNLGYLPADINIKQYHPFEKKIVSISKDIYDIQNDKNLSVSKKRMAIAQKQKEDRALRKKFPQYAKTKARLNVKATGFEGGLMIKEKLPDPSIAIAPDEAGTTLKETIIGTEKEKALTALGKNNLQKLAVIGCGPKAARMGGRIGLNEGQNLQACALRGVEKLQTTDVKKLTPGDKANIKAITKTVQGGRILKNILGPGALAIEGLFAAPFAAYDYARGRPGIDVAKSAFSLGLLDQKLTDAELKKIYPEYGQAADLENIGDRLSTLEKMQKGTRGQKIRSKPKFEKAEQKFKTALQPFLDTGDPEKAYFENIQKTQEARDELDRQYNIRKQNRTTQFDLSNPFMAAGGGIAKEAGDSSGVAPARGPTPQGLLSLKNRVRNY